MESTTLDKTLSEVYPERQCKFCKYFEKRFDFKGFGECKNDKTIDALNTIDGLSVGNGYSFKNRILNVGTDFSCINFESKKEN